MSGKARMVFALVCWGLITLMNIALVPLEVINRDPGWEMVASLLLIAVGTFQTTTYAAALRMRGRR